MNTNAFMQQRLKWISNDIRALLLWYNKTHYHKNNLNDIPSQVDDLCIAAIDKLNEAKELLRNEML